MKNRRLALLPGLSLFVCFCLLVGTGGLVSRLGGGAALTACAELISFLLPLLLLLGGIRDRKTLKKRLKYRRLPRGAMRMSVCLGLAAAVLSLFLNLLLYQAAGLAGVDLSATALDAPQSTMGPAARLLVVVLLSAVVEEVYLRGALLTAYEGIAGTAPCLIMSGVVFAMLHGNVLNFAGPLVAGIAYAYLTYAFGSVWPAILAHAVNNLYYCLTLWLTDTYGAFGLWKYFTELNGLLLLLFLYLTLRSAERLLARGDIPHFEKSAGGYDALLLIRNPGMLAFLLAFAARAVLHWL